MVDKEQKRKRATTQWVEETSLIDRLMLAEVQATNPVLVQSLLAARAAAFDQIERSHLEERFNEEVKKMRHPKNGEAAVLMNIQQFDALVAFALTCTAEEVSAIELKLRQGEKPDYRKRS
ncbi:hypothetical protein C5B42_03840 [Candidatus Cerribacteria bacterium 'Amazon FNV 2010 28 9']|uniref:Uncharacterized protein n=1 Tax=Candidatus Cerribacteria bacterium 'Amazon FNV 2010 28 9' TaxID=2081795 RepID=A0A317JPN1_9BACT|nr:MAG: hypothetical protein C5B42_03840 [Candidatus Cerribacteria bacterium 'Amazon FNV 2010 28 9']